MQISLKSTPNVERLGVLRDRLTSARAQRRKQLGSFFAGLGPRLAGARAVEAELAHRIASRFNVFDYLRDDELGFSRVVSDLLDPTGPHGQRTLFLDAFLRLIGDLEDRQTIDEGHVAVTTERAIDTGSRRLDISVVISAPGQPPRCIAIENKPYADDRDGQVQAYRQWLDHEYDGRFLLIYLSPHGGRPAENSLPAGACTRGLATMPYTPVADTGDIADLRVEPPLMSWFARCAQVCEVDRLRWFLRDAEAFCHKRFGGTTTMPSEIDEVRSFVLESDDNMRTAIAVYEAWPQVRNEVVARFLTKVKDRIAGELTKPENLGQDLRFGSAFDGKSTGDGLWLYRESWRMPDSNARPYVWLAHDGREPNSWYWSVQLQPRVSGSPAEQNLRSRLKGLESRIPGKAVGHSQNWPWFRYVEDDFADWSPLAFRMHAGGIDAERFMDRLGRQFVQLATTAVPIIDEVLAATPPCGLGDDDGASPATGST